jgi:hypothetical protein
LLNISFTVHKLYTWLTHPKQLCGMPDMSLVSLTGVPGKEETIKLTYVNQQNVALPFLSFNVHTGWKVVSTAVHTFNMSSQW